MSYSNKVVWSEGLFLRPHHLQQQDRHVCATLDARLRAVGGHYWGFRELELSEEMRLQGRVAITKASGVFPDGTPFDIPASDPPPDPLAVPSGTTDQEIYLSLPIARPGLPEIDETADSDSRARYRSEPLRVADATRTGDSFEDIDVARLRLALMLERDPDTHEQIGVVRVKERASDWLDLDPSYIAPCTDVRASRALEAHVREVRALMSTRAKELAEAIGGAAMRTLPDGDDLLLLMSIGRGEPVLDHFSRVGGLHPETLFLWGASLAGELSALRPPNRRLPEMPVYDHTDLESSFRPLFHALVDALSFRRQQSLFPLRLTRVRRGHEWRINRRDLLEDAEFWLGVSSAGQKLSEIREQVERSAIVAPAASIEELANRQVSGIPLEEADPPGHIRRLDGFIYYRLDKASPYWTDLVTADALQIRLHGLTRPELQLYAVRH